jgi:hypothetical protein
MAYGERGHPRFSATAREDGLGDTPPPAPGKRLALPLPQLVVKCGESAALCGTVGDAGGVGPGSARICLWRVGFSTVLSAGDWAKVVGLFKTLTPVPTQEA